MQIHSLHSLGLVHSHSGLVGCTIGWAASQRFSSPFQLQIRLAVSSFSFPHGIKMHLKRGYHNFDLFLNLTWGTTKKVIVWTKTWPKIVTLNIFVPPTIILKMVVHVCDAYPLFDCCVYIQKYRLYVLTGQEGSNTYSVMQCNATERKNHAL